MGKAFAKAVKDYINSTDATAAQLGLDAGLTATAATNWKNGTALPERASLDRLLSKIENKEWHQRILDAWREDQTLPEVWRDFMNLRELNEDAAEEESQAEGPPYDLLRTAWKKADSKDRRSALSHVIRLVAEHPERLRRLVDVAKLVLEPGEEVS